LRQAIARYDLRFLVRAMLPQAAPSTGDHLLVPFHFAAREFPRVRNVSWNDPRGRVSAA
jgi:hypothetical protein